MDRSKKHASNRKRLWKQDGDGVKVREERKMKTALAQRELNEVLEMVCNTNGILNLLGQPNPSSSGWMWMVFAFFF